MTNARVFISYARQDGEAFATRLRRRIESEQPEITVWQDRRRMEGGIGWWKQITTALDAVEYLILVMTPAALKSEVSRKEWRYARQAGVCVFPVKGVPDSELDFPAMPLWMRQAQFYDIDREWEIFVERLKSPCHADRVPFMAPDLPAGFFPRNDLTGQILDSILDPGRQNPRPGTSVLYGAGGLGKTTLAAAICHNEDVMTAFPDGILWATLGDKHSPIAGLTGIYAALTGERPQFVSEGDAAIEVARRLEDRHFLIVIDDVWTQGDLNPFLRGGAGCVRLITTRQFDIAIDLAAAGRRFRTPPMEADEAVGMLLAGLETQPADPAPFRALAGRLYQWPLMLKLARSALKLRLARGDSMAGALAHIDRALALKDPTVFDCTDAADRHGGLSQTIQVSLDLLGPADQRSCFELSVFPEDVDIPIENAGLVWGANPFQTERLAARLDDLSLLEFDLQRACLRLHDLMRSYFRSKLAAEAPLHQRLIDAWGDPKTLNNSSAWQWYVYHLVGAGHSEAAIRLLTDFDWLRAKLAHTGINAIPGEYAYVPHSRELGLIRSAIRLGAHAVNSEPELAAQLLGRLAGDSAEERALLEGAARYSGRVWLRPLCASLTRPGGPILHLLTGHEGPIRDIAVSRDGLRVASASSVKDEVKIWDVATWSAPLTLTGHTLAVNAVDISADGRVVLSGSDDGTAKVWNADTGAELFTLPGHTAAVRAVALAKAAPRAVTGSFDQTITVWNLETGLALHTFQGHEDWIRAVVITDEGDRIVSSSMDSTFRVWDVLSGSPVRELRIHQQPARALALCPQSMRLLSGADDGSVKTWNLDGSDVRTLCESGAAIQSVSASADGKRAISLSLDEKLCVWDLQSSRCIRTLESPAGNLTAAAIAPGGLWAITGSHDQTLRVWDLESSSSGPAVHGHRQWVNAVAITADGKRAVSGSYDGTIKIWDAATGAELHEIATDGGAVRAVAIGGGTIVSGSREGLRISDLTNAGLARVSTLTGAINAVAIDRDGKRGVSGSPDGVLRIWDLESGALLYIIRGHSISILAVSMNAEGTLALSASSDGTVKCWDVNAGREIRTLRGHGDFVRCVSVAPEGVRAISGSSHGGLKLWDLSSGSELLDTRADIGTVNALAMISGGHRAVTGSADHTVRLWDLDAASVMASFTTDDVVTACAVAHDGRAIVAGDASGAVHFLRVEGE